MPTPQQKQAAPDFIPADPDFIPADGGSAPASSASTPAPKMAAQPGNIFTADHPLDTLMANAKEAGPQILDIGKGMAKGAVHTMSTADDWATKHLPAWMTTPIGQSATPENSAAATAYAKKASTPTNTAQTGGKALEQGLEFMAPTGIEEGLAKFGSAALGKVGQVGVKMLGSALHSGAVNKAQGGSFAGGAAMGAAGSAVGQGIKAVAPVMAETALRVRGADRAYGRTPGQAILDETTGMAPRKIASQAGAKVSQYENKLLDNARQSPVQVDLQNPRDVAQSWVDTALERNHPPTTKDVARMADQLSTRDGFPIPQHVSAKEGLLLRRGIDNAQTNWNPTTVSDFTGRAVNNTRNALADELRPAIPEYDELNSKMSSLMPVAKRATAADLNAGFVQRSLGRFGAHTGALAGAGIGGAAGYKEGGIPGAAVGAGMGVLLPEAISSPEVQMMMARGANSKALQKFVIPAATGMSMQLGRKKKEE